jgi:uncharacterized protein YndB with AHSA1/START domain
MAGERSGAAGGTQAREVALTRVFDAPRPAVFEAWSRKRHLKAWWGPDGFTLPGCDIDFRVGGAYRFVMRGPDGEDYPFHGRYLEIVAPERIVFTAVLEDLPGEELLAAVTFEEERGRTRLLVQQTVPASEPHARGQVQGWTESLDRLVEYLAQS